MQGAAGAIKISLSFSQPGPPAHVPEETTSFAVPITPLVPLAIGASEQTRARAREHGKTSHGLRDNPSVGAAKYFNFRRMETPRSLASPALTHLLCRGTKRERRAVAQTELPILRLRQPRRGREGTRLLVNCQYDKLRQCDVRDNRPGSSALTRIKIFSKILLSLNCPARLVARIRGVYGVTG